MAINFDKYAQEGNTYLNNLADEMGHSDEKERVGTLLKSVLHALRDRITIEGSLNLLAQLPSFLKTVYVENWTYRENIERLKTKEEFLGKVEENQLQFGEQNFEWNQSTEELVGIVLGSLSEYISEGEIEHIMAQLPEEISDYFKAKMAG